MPLSSQSSSQSLSNFEPAHIVSAPPRSRSWRPNWARLGIVLVTLALWGVLIWGGKLALHALGH